MAAAERAKSFDSSALTHKSKSSGTELEIQLKDLKITNVRVIDLRFPNKKALGITVAIDSLGLALLS